MKQNLNLSDLSAIIKQKIAAQEQGSYTYELVQKGLEKITRKVGEEALEVVIAAFLRQNNNSEKLRQDLIGEVCDLFYHLLVLLAYEKIELDEILQELNRRNEKHK